MLTSTIGIKEIIRVFGEIRLSDLTASHGQVLHPKGEAFKRFETEIAQKVFESAKEY